MPRAELGAELRRLAVGLGLALAMGAPAAAEKREITEPSYLALPALTAPIIRPEGGRGVVTVTGGLDAPDLALRERAALSIPRLVDAYAQTLRRYASSLSPGRPPDLDLLGRQLQTDTDRTLGRAGARFLFGAVLVN